MLNLREEALKAIKERADQAEDRILANASRAAKKALTVAKTKLRAIEDYKTSMDFEVEVAKGSAIAHGYDFKACWARMKKLFPKSTLAFWILRPTRMKLKPRLALQVL